MANVKSIITNSQGNVLINTETDNGYRLNISGNTYTSGDLVAGGYGFFNGEGLGTSVRVGGIYGDLGLYVASTYDMQFDLGWSGSFKFTYSNVDKFRIDSSGFLYNNSGYLAYGDGTFTNLYAPDANGGITMGDATGPINVYYNDTHTFQSAGQLINYGGFTSTGFGVGTVAPSSKLEVVKQGNASGGTMLLSGSKTNNATKYGIIATTQYASNAETEGVGLIGGVNTSTENIVVVGGGIDELNTATSIRFFAAANTTTRGSANERMRVNAANDSGNLYIGTTSTNDYGRLIVNGFSGAWLPYIAGTSLSYNQYGIVVGNSNTANANIGGGLTLVNNTASVGAYSPVISWSSMSAGGTYNSTYAFITGVYGGQGGDANWAIGDMIFGTAETYGASERMRIRYNGNVLIGTTTDSGYKLSVAGNVVLGYAQNRPVFYDSGGGNFQIKASAGGWATGYFFQGSGGTYRGGWGGFGSGNDLGYLWAGDAYDTPTMVVQGGQGNVGIGTTAPQKKLEVISGANNFVSVGVDQIGVGSWAGIQFGYRESNSNYRKSAIVFERTDLTANDAQGKIHILNGPQGSAGSATLADAKITIAENGNVGIGTNNPGIKLDVNGPGRFVSDAASRVLYLKQDAVNSGNIIQFQNQAGSNIWEVVGRNNQFYIYNENLSNFPLFIHPSTSNVSLSTASDNGFKLNVNGNASVGNADGTMLYVLGSSGNNAQTGFDGGGTYYEVAGSTSARRKLRLQVFDGTSGYAQFFIDGANNYIYTSANTNFGVGTGSPAYKLDVSGSARVNSTSNLAMFIKTSSGFGAGISYEDSTTGGNDVVHAGAIGSNFYIATGYSEQMRVSSSGNVIIGNTTDAGYKLDVHGEILGRDDIRILNTYALILNGTDANWRIGRNTITDSGWLTGNTMQMVVFGGQTGQGFQVVNTNGTALFEIDGVAGASRFTNALGVGVNPSGTAGRIDASNDIVAFSTSDRRFKENITPIANALDKVKTLTGVEFDWKKETKDYHGYVGHDVGVIAQDVQAVLPEAVRTNANGYLAVRYEKIIGLLVEAMKEQQDQIDELKTKIDGLTK